MLGLACALLCLSTGGSRAQQGGIDIGLRDAPTNGALRVLLFDQANTFGDLRDPVRLETFELGDGARLRLDNVPAGTYAIMLHFDENGNGALDKNFIGIPTEPIAFSNGYRPKGPPSYSQARFDLVDGADLTMDLDLFRALGKRGRLGLGLGVIIRSAPYRQYSGAVYQVIPAASYNGNRLQILGPQVLVRILGRKRVRLGAVAAYRIGAYKEDDSPYLAGMGDRDSTLMAGLGLRAELPAGVDLSMGAATDVLNRIDGSEAQAALSKSFQWRIFRIAPRLGMTWLSADLANHDYGVPAEAATPQRPAYAPGEAFGLEVGTGAFVELSRDWRLIGNIAVERFDDTITDSPIVDDDYVVKGFGALTYVF